MSDQLSQPGESDPRVLVRDEAHAVLGALIHSAVTTDLQSSSEGFRRARDLGLIFGVNPQVTPLGRGVLRALGLLVPDADS